MSLDCFNTDNLSPFVIFFGPYFVSHLTQVAGEVADIFSK